MNFLDLAVLGIESQMSEDSNFVSDSIRFRFRKGDIFAERLVSREELVRFNGDSSMMESFICKEALNLISEEEKKHEVKEKA